MFLMAEALAESDSDAVAVIRDAEAIVVDALFNDVIRSLTLTTAATTPGRSLREPGPGFGASYYRHAQGDRTTACFWARSPPLVGGR